MDEGCSCKACDIKRTIIANKLLNNMVLSNNAQIKHEESKNQLIEKRVSVENKINKINIIYENRIVY
jgi:hypothetical protein